MIEKRSIVKDKKGFTGLEAAIVLTAFIVVAAVFSYMVLGAGFFSTEKAKAVVHSGVEQATSSAELVGDVIGRDTDDDDQIEYISFTLQLTAGQSPLDMSMAVVSFTNASYHVSSEIKSTSFYEDDGDDLLEPNEKVEVNVTLTYPLVTNDAFQLEFKPASGGSLPIARRTAGAIDKVNRLY